MKIVAVILLAALAINECRAEAGQINLANSLSSIISNSVTVLHVRSADGINILPYFAPAGTTDEALFTPSFPSIRLGSPFMGRYNGGIRTLSEFSAGTTVNVQMRAFETNYGTTYEAAFGAPVQNGRRAMIGKSAIAQITLTAAGETAPTTAACGGFWVNVAAGGSFLVVNDLVVAEGTNGVVNGNFRISLLETQAQTVSVDFTTIEGTALAGSDYVATNGTLTFAPGENQKIVSVEVTGDSPVESDEVFYLNITNAVNATIMRSAGHCTITEVRITGFRVDTAVSFNTVPNRRYLVERSTDSISWTPVTGSTNVAGTGGIVTIVDQGNGSLVTTVYRASVLPP